MSDKKIAVLVPCYNEEKTVEKVSRDFMAALPEATVYVYDNNSTDRTYEIATSIGERVVVRKEYRQGKGNVVRSMFRDIDADCYIMIDGDDTYPAEHAREMCDYVLNDGFDMVIGDRLSSTYFSENKRMFHGFGNKLVRWLINKLFKSDIKDIMTGYRAFSYDFVKMMPITSSGFEIETEMTINALDKRFNIKEIPINFRDRPEGSVSKLNTFSDGMKVLRTIAVMFKEYRPMMFFGAIAWLFILVSVGFFIPVFMEYLTTHQVPRFPTLIFSLICAVIGVISFAIGVILDVLVKKNKQDFIIRLNILSSKKDK
ncbi:MAG: glycosyltransferase [Firmicutes bacterium]|nr:glycosyltransferase [Bacillota bacterium]